MCQNHCAHSTPKYSTISSTAATRQNQSIHEYSTISSTAATCQNHSIHEYSTISSTAATHENHSYKYSTISSTAATYQNHTPLANIQQSVQLLLYISKPQSTRKYSTISSTAATHENHSYKYSTSVQLLLHIKTTLHSQIFNNQSTAAAFCHCLTVYF